VQELWRWNGGNPHVWTWYFALLFTLLRVVDLRWRREIVREYDSI
jgi:hypothetical protein